MQQANAPQPFASVLTELVKRCQALCQSAESALGHLSTERGDFLSSTLGDVLGQLELVLRAVGQDPAGPKRVEERRSFLRKLFNRSQVETDHVFEAPSFTVSRQGLQGNASTVSMDELLSFLAMGRKTGVLWVDTPSENFMISLVEGRVTHAASDSTPEGLRMGEVLVGMGYLTRRQLERFVEQTKKSAGQVSGEFLVESGMISAEELQSALKQQVKKLVERVIQNKTALFRFREGMEIVMSHHVKMDVNHLLLESVRAQDEAANANLRATAHKDSWSSWQEQLTAEVADATGTKPAALEAKSTPEPKAAEKKPEQAAVPAKDAAKDAKDAKAA
jgi:hypothetical protein